MHLCSPAKLHERLLDAETEAAAAAAASRGEEREEKRGNRRVREYRNFRFQSKLGLRATTVLDSETAGGRYSLRRLAQEDGRKMGPSASFSSSSSAFFSFSSSSPSSSPSPPSFLPVPPFGKIDSNSLYEYLSRALKS